MNLFQEYSILKIKINRSRFFLIVLDFGLYRMECFKIIFLIQVILDIDGVEKFRIVLYVFLNSMLVNFEFNTRVIIKLWLHACPHHTSIYQVYSFCPFFPRFPYKPELSVLKFRFLKYSKMCSELKQELQWLHDKFHINIE